jgi:hypothetical protein
MATTGLERVTEVYGASAAQADCRSRPCGVPTEPYA